MADLSLRRTEFVNFQTEIRQEFSEIRDSLRRLSVERERGCRKYRRQTTSMKGISAYEDDGYIRPVFQKHGSAGHDRIGGLNRYNYYDRVPDREQHMRYKRYNDDRQRGEILINEDREDNNVPATKACFQAFQQKFGHGFCKSRDLLANVTLQGNGGRIRNERQSLLEEESPRDEDEINVYLPPLVHEELVVDSNLPPLFDNYMEEEVVNPSALTPIFDVEDEVVADFPRVYEELSEETSNAYKMFDQSPKRDSYQFSVYTSPNHAAMKPCSSTTFVQSEKVRENSVTNYHPVREVEPPDKLVISRTNYESFIQLLPHVSFNPDISKLNLYVCAKYIFFLPTFSKPCHEKSGRTVSGLGESIACRLAFAISLHNLIDNICLWLLCVHAYEDSLCENYSSHLIHDLSVRISCDKNCGAAKILRELIPNSETEICREPKPLCHGKGVDIHDYV